MVLELVRKIKSAIMMWIPLMLLMTCSVMDDKAIPPDQFNQVEISDFEVNLQRDYIRGKIQNNGKHDITSSIFRFDLYSENASAPENDINYKRGSMLRYTGGDSLNPSRLLLSQNFVVREPLKPGYSTEFYFELKMDYDLLSFLYTYEIIQLKGR